MRHQVVSRIWITFIHFCICLRHLSVNHMLVGKHLAVPFAVNAGKLKEAEALTGEQATERDLLSKEAGVGNGPAPVSCITG